MLLTNQKLINVSETEENTAANTELGNKTYVGFIGYALKPMF